MEQEARRAATQRDSDSYWARTHRTHGQAPQGQMLDRLRGALGLGPRDHLAAAAAKMERMEAAEAAARGTAAAPAKPPSLVAEASGKSATPVPSRTHSASIALKAQSSAGGEAPLPNVQPRAPQPQQRAMAAPSWASRDSRAPPKPGMFGKWFASS